MPQNFKKYIFIFSILLLFAHLSPTRAEEKAVPEGLTTAEWLECVDQVVNEFNPPIKACLEKNRYRYELCDKIIAEQNEASDKEIKKRCVAVPKEKISSPSTDQTAQDQSSNSNQSEIPNYTRALVENPPKESDFQKVPKSDFKKVNPEGTASASPKSATQTAEITGSVFIGKVGDAGKILIDLPDGKTIILTDNQTAFDGEMKKWRLIRDGGQSLSPTPLQMSIYEKDCHLDIRPANETRWASDWSGNNVITKTVGDCNYSNDEDPVRVLVDTGRVNFRTQSGVGIEAGKADFGIAYDSASGQSVVEVYNGSITVTSTLGNSKTISTVYGSKIRHLEVAKDGVMAEKIAIPESQWEEFLASNQQKKDETGGNSLPIAGAVVVLGLGGVIFFLYRTGKLIPLYRITIQKIVGIFNKIHPEKKRD